jgi:hypothetical protein
MSIEYIYVINYLSIAVLVFSSFAMATRIVILASVTYVASTFYLILLNNGLPWALLSLVLLMALPLIVSSFCWLSIKALRFNVETKYGKGSVGHVPFDIFSIYRILYKGSVF